MINHSNWQNKNANKITFCFFCNRDAAPEGLLCSCDSVCTHFICIYFQVGIAVPTCTFSPGSTVKNIYSVCFARVYFQASTARVIVFLIKKLMKGVV